MRNIPELLDEIDRLNEIIEVYELKDTRDRTAENDKNDSLDALSHNNEAREKVKLSMLGLSIAVAKAFEVPVNNLKSRRKDRDTFVNPRIMYCYLAKKLLNRTYQDIGDTIYRDHSTVMHNCNSADNLLSIKSRDKQFHIKYLECKEILCRDYSYKPDSFID
jgi:chromosomal replication initiation ATPase DnaA